MYNLFDNNMLWRFDKMKGEKHFTRYEADQIISLIKQKKEPIYTISDYRKYIANEKNLFNLYTVFHYRESIVNEKDLFNFDQYLVKRTYKFISTYPLTTMKLILNKSLHIILLNPFHIFSDHNFVSSEVYYHTDTHDKLVPIRIVYSIFIYFIPLYA